MTAAEYVAGVREFADWVEANAETLEHNHGLAGTLGTLYRRAATKEELAEYARVMGKARKEIDVSGDFALIRDFGPVCVHAYSERETVCRRVVTGTRVVTEQVPDPEALRAVPLIKVEREEEIVTWECDPLFAGTEVPS